MTLTCSATLGSVGTATGQEVGWTESGGGFSNQWPRPSWQRDAVDAYLAQKGLPSRQYWNVTGRGIPDVAALAENYQGIVCIAKVGLRSRNSGGEGTNQSRSQHAGLFFVPAGTVYTGGTVSSVSGTSAAAPVFAGMIALVNAARLDAQKPTLGFLVRNHRDRGPCFESSVVHFTSGYEMR